MADRFPSIEDFDEGDTKAHDAPTNAGASGEDDFLARERAALGEDAAQFETPGDSKAAQVEDAGEDDLLGGGDDFPAMSGGGAAASHGGGGEEAFFESSFPAIDTQNDQVAPGGAVTGSGYGQQSTSYSAPEEEPEVIREWRERRDLALKHRAETAETKKQETIKSAQQAVDDFYENYNNKKEKGISQTRKEAEEFLAKRDDTTSGGTSWERISKLVDLSGKGAKGGASGSGKDKFRELLTNLRKAPEAPGASGV